MWFYVHIGGVHFIDNFDRFVVDCAGGVVIANVLNVFFVYSFATVPLHFFQAPYVEYNVFVA